MSAGWRSEARAAADHLAADWLRVNDRAAPEVRFLLRALDALDAVLALHAPDERNGVTTCLTCEPLDWPCPTVKAIEGPCSECGGTGFLPEPESPESWEDVATPCPVCPTVRAIEGEQDA